MKIFKTNSDTIVSYSAMVVAVVSIAISLWLGLQTIKHNKLSVRPRLEIIYATNPKTFGYFIDNNGLGPAIITKKKIFFRGTEINSTMNASWHGILQDSLGIKDMAIRYEGLGEGVSLKLDDRKDLMIFGEPDEELLRKLDFMQIYQDVRIEIVYESMYGETFKVVCPK